MSLTAVLMCNCINDTLTHQYKRLDDGGWDRSDTLVFDLPEVKVSGVYLPRVLMRSGNLFPYSKLWVCYEVNLEYPRFTGKDTAEKGEAFIASLSDEEKEKLKIAQDF